MYIDSNGIIHLINKKNSLCRSKYIDEKDIISKIELLLDNKPIIRKFNKQELDNWNKEFIDFCNNNKYNFEEVLFGFTIKEYIFQIKEDESYFINVFVIYEHILNRSKINEVMEQLSYFFKKYIDQGVLVTFNVFYKENKLTLKLNNICYKCKIVIDRKTRYSYLCIKCTNEGVVKQYCERCVRFFDSFKKFGSQLTILNDIEEYNKYLNNHTLDDKPCNNEHLLLFLPIIRKVIENGSTEYQINNDEKDISFFTDLPTYLEYTSPSRHNQQCDACYVLSDYERKSDSYDADYNYASFDNSLFDYYTQDGLYNEMRHLQRTTGTYTPLFYCVVCNLYLDWECFSRFHRYIGLYEHEFYDYQYLRHNYENKHYKENELFRGGYTNVILGKPDDEIEKFIVTKEGLTEESIKIINESQKTGEIQICSKLHKAWHPSIIIQGKGVRLSYRDFVFPSIYRDINPNKNK